MLSVVLEVDFCCLGHAKNTTDGLKEYSKQLLSFELLSNRPIFLELLHARSVLELLHAKSVPKLDVKAEHFTGCTPYNTMCYIISLW